MEEKKSKYGDILSESVSEIIGRPPSWLVRRGTGVFLMTLLVLLAGSWLYRYPDVIRARVVLTTKNPAVPLVARNAGKIESLRVSNGQQVREGEIAAVLENPARTEDILRLSELLGSAEKGKDDESFLVLAGDELVLGEVQEVWARFIKAVRDLANFRELDSYGKKMLSVQEEMKNYRQFLFQAEKEVGILEQDCALAEKQFRRDSLLYAGDIIPEAGLEQARALLLQKGRELQRARLGASEASIRLSEKNREWLDLRLEQQTEEETKRRQYEETAEILRAALAKWQQEYLLYAPAPGRVNLTRFWSEEQYVQEGETVLSIVPDHPGQMIGRSLVSQDRSGKLKEGQKVLIRIDQYPYLEFGWLAGRVGSISQVPEKEQYMVEILLTDSLRTTYGNMLSFSEGMQGSAEIITDERPLLVRIMAPFRFLYERYVKNREQL